MSRGPRRTARLLRARAGGPVRMCVACGRRAPQAELARYAAGPDGPAPGRAPGRGAYVCPTGRCARRAAERKLVERALAGRARRRDDASGAAAGGA